MATSIRLVPEMEQRLDFLALQTGRTKAYYLREIIEQGIEDMEDYYLAADVLERVRKGQEQTHSAAEVWPGQLIPFRVQKDKNHPRKLSFPLSRTTVRNIFRL
jgi:RHH-type rel operon transcriptional repressor/antitoxin RelB